MKRLFIIDGWYDVHKYKINSEVYFAILKNEQVSIPYNILVELCQEKRDKVIEITL